MSPEMEALAETPEQRKWLELANSWCASTTPLGRRMCSALAYRAMRDATPGQQLGSWEDLTSAVAAFREREFWTSDNAEPAVPSREAVADRVVLALVDVAKLGRVAS